MKRLIFLVLCAPLAIMAQTPVVTCAAGTNSAQEGQAINCTSSSSVNVTLTGVGTLGGALTNTTAWTYTAPASVKPQNIMGGCPVMPNDSIYNTDIYNLPVIAAGNPTGTGQTYTVSGSVMADNLVGSGVNLGFSTIWAGTTLADNTTPVGNLKDFYGEGTHTNFVLPNAPNLVRENGIYRSHWDNNDHHQIAVRTTDCTFWEIYNLYFPNGDSAYNGCQNGTVGCTDTGAISYGWSNYALTGGTDAAGFPLASLTLHLDEIKSGAIHHALRMTNSLGGIRYTNPFWPAEGIGGCSANNIRPNSTLTAAVTTPTSSLPVASAADYEVGEYVLINSEELLITAISGTTLSVNPGQLGTTAANHASGASVYLSCANTPPYGARMRLKSSFNISGYTPQQQVILTAEQYYGVFLADVGSQATITVSPDITEDPTISLPSVPINSTNFEFVDESSLISATNSVRVNPANGHSVTALDSAVITATPTGSGSAVSTPIAIQGVAIGLNSPELTMEAGTYSYQIPSWVTGTANQTVNWSLFSGSGSITSGGIYTPPAVVSSTSPNPTYVTGSGANELGYKFTTSTNGYIQGVRFYKNAAESGTHTGSLWNASTQALLATATFTETASGWQDVHFSSAVAVSTGTTYVVSYHEADGTEYYSSNFFASSYSNSPLTIPSGGAVFLSGSSGGNYPTSTGSNNYWVDVDFSTSATGGTITNIFAAYVPNNAAVLEATSAADSNAVAFEYVTLLPVGSNPTGSVRIDNGTANGTTAGGNTWLGDQGYETSGYIKLGGDYPGWGATSNPDLAIYQSTGYTDGSDMLYRFIVPNGNYKVRSMFGQPYSGWAGYTTTISEIYHGRMNIEAQGQIAAHNYNFMATPVGQYDYDATPSDAYIPARVTNNTLEIAVRGVWLQMDDVYFNNTDCESCVGALLDGLEIVPDSTPAHWAIDTQQQTTLAPGPSYGSFTAKGAQYELGTAFYSNTAGYIAGVRFYKGSSDTGTHTASLWKVSYDNSNNIEVSSKLATATYSGETATGWQSVNFSSPVAITAGYIYVVSYNSPTGNAAWIPSGYFKPAYGFSNGNLWAFANMTAAGVGFALNTGINKGGDMYLVDPIFSTASNGSNPVTLFPTNGMPGQQLLIYQVDWYTGLSDAQWSILSGPGTIIGATDKNGAPCAIYTAPSTQPDAGTAVIIQAQSASNPSVLATTTLYFTGTNFAGK